MLGDVFIDQDGHLVSADLVVQEGPFEELSIEFLHLLQHRLMHRVELITNFDLRLLGGLPKLLVGLLVFLADALGHLLDLRILRLLRDQFTGLLLELVVAGRPLHELLFQFLRVFLAELQLLAPLAILMLLMLLAGLTGLAGLLTLLACLSLLAKLLLALLLLLLTLLFLLLTLLFLLLTLLGLLCLLACLAGLTGLLTRLLRPCARRYSGCESRHGENLFHIRSFPGWRLSSSR